MIQNKKSKTNRWLKVSYKPKLKGKSFKLQQNRMMIEMILKASDRSQLWLNTKMCLLRENWKMALSKLSWRVRKKQSKLPRN
jgi:hypothetical protein